MKRTMDEFQLFRRVLTRRYSYVIIPTLPQRYKPTKLHLNQRRIQRFLDALLRSELLKSDVEFYQFLTRSESIQPRLQQVLKDKPRELGLFNVYTETGEVRIHTDMISAVYASKFPEYLHTYHTAYDGAFAALKDVRKHSSRLGQLYGKLYSNLVELDMLNKEYLQVEEDFSLLNMG